MPTSHAKLKPSSNALASASNSPRSTANFLLKGASSLPSWSHINYNPYF